MTPTRQRLIDAADRLMYLHGYEAVGVAELCREAGARKGSFYHFFDSKQSLAIEMLERSWERTNRIVFERALHGGGDAADAQQRPAAAAFGRFGDVLAENLERIHAELGRVPGCRFGNFAAELACNDDAVRSCVNGVFERMLDHFESVIVAGQSSGELSAELDARERARAVLAQMEGLQLLAKASGDPGVLRQLGPSVQLLLQ